MDKKEPPMIPLYILTNGYSTGRFLGDGCLGTVYVVKKDNQIFAKKNVIMNKNDIMDVFNSFEFMKEFDSAYLLKFYDHFWSGNILCLVSELFTEGMNLRKVLEGDLDGKIIDLKISMKIFLQLVLGLEYLHDRNITHGNLIPENIFVKNEKWDVKIGDFGLGRLIKASKTKINPSLEYFAPEAIYNLPNDKSDVWSLGVVMYEMVEKRLPFDVRALLFGETMRPMQPFVDPDIVSLVSGMLERDITKRLSIKEIKKERGVLKYAHQTNLSQYFHDK